MKRNYNFVTLAKEYGFEPSMVEKVCRISDILEDISAVRFLRDRLSLYGGTAFTFIYSQESTANLQGTHEASSSVSTGIQRLSIDIDLNYRHLDQKDWGEVRRVIDERIKTLLYRRGYEESAISINPSYPLARIIVGYVNHEGLKDSYNIEIGYMRRYPVLRNDSLADFRHIGTGETFPIKTPIKEELFSNKWCTLLYRGTPRDLFDVFQITKMDIDPIVFRKCAVIDSLMRGEPKLHEIDLNEVIDDISIDSSLRNLLCVDLSSTLNIKHMLEKSKEFSRSIISSLEEEEVDVINRFYEHREFEPERLDKEGILNPKTAEHPSILWAMKKL
ncbi:MAG: nucleotidyl transferase AbiEii/AbiGii toxin family protein [Thermoplasmata archaeon]